MKNSRDLTDIEEVIDIHAESLPQISANNITQDVNQKLKEGWILLNTYVAVDMVLESDHQNYIHYVLGKPKR